MSTIKFHPRNAVLLLIIIAIAAIRLLNNFDTHVTVLANYSPLAAMALFGGTYFKGVVKPLLFPIAAIFMSDVILFSTVYKNYSNGFLYDGWVCVYIAFVLIALCGKLIIKKLNAQNIALAIVSAVFIHWIVTDFGEWYNNKSLPQTWAGFNAFLTAAIPFELRLLVATIIYSIIMFGVFEWMQNRYQSLKLA